VVRPGPAASLGKAFTQRGKNDKARIVPLNPNVRQVLSALRPVVVEGHVFRAGAGHIQIARTSRSSAPGHTEGHISFVARTLSGPVLMTGNVCHTR
jgi:hypothetical protein